MSSRTRARADARRAQKLQNQLDFGHSAASSKTLIETCMDEIVRATKEALYLKDEGWGKNDGVYARASGHVNGLVWMYCKCWVNPYEPHLSNSVKSVRREAVKRARAQMAEEAAR